jgi:hypothetical protein
MLIQYLILKIRVPFSHEEKETDVCLIKVYVKSETLIIKKNHKNGLSSRSIKGSKLAVLIHLFEELRNHFLHKN